LLHALPVLLRGGVVVAVVAHGSQLRGLDVAQVPLHELDATEGRCLADNACQSPEIALETLAPKRKTFRLTPFNQWITLCHDGF
jgi:hypothetical protein